MNFQSINFTLIDWRLTRNHKLNDLAHLILLPPKIRNVFSNLIIKYIATRNHYFGDFDFERMSFGIGVFCLWRVDELKLVGYPRETRRTGN